MPSTMSERKKRYTISSHDRVRSPERVSLLLLASAVRLRTEKINKKTQHRRATFDANLPSGSPLIPMDKSPTSRRRRAVKSRHGYGADRGALLRSEADALPHPPLLKSSNPTAPRTMGAGD
ncbi:hypothetical protein GW17_00051639 [Ensete ventricosum]|nr:hypothetical protein GW17_00051639 [Ensete ventricosum]